MCTFVPNFDHDIFVSYAHVDNRKYGRDEAQPGWVDMFVDNLRESLSQRLGRTGSGEIWLDRRLAGNEPFPNDIRRAVEHSATMLLFLSEGYLLSDWCQKERDIFLKTVNPKAKDEGRVFMVRLTDLKRKRWPGEFAGLKGYKFYQKANSDASAYALGTPSADDPNEQQYFQRLDDISGQLCLKLRQMQESAFTAVAADTTTLIETHFDSSIFLAETSPDLNSFRNNFRRHFHQIKIRVLPEKFYDRTPDKFKSAMEKDLKQCKLYVQLFGKYMTPKAPDLPLGYEGLQLEVAKAIDMPIMRWFSSELPETEISADLKKLLDGAEYMMMDFEDFKRGVEKKARATTTPRERNGALVLIKADETDQEIAVTVGEELYNRSIGYDIANEPESLLNLTERYSYQAVMVIYGQCDQEWVQRQVRDCRELTLKKKSRAPVCAVYETVPDPPTYKMPLRIKPPRFHFLSQQNPSTFTKFVAAIEIPGATQ